MVWNWTNRRNNRNNLSQAEQTQSSRGRATVPGFICSGQWNLEKIHEGCAKTQVISGFLLATGH